MMGFAQLSVFGGYSIYFPELFPTRLRGTGVGLCYNTDRKSTRLNSSHTVIYTLSLHDALPIYDGLRPALRLRRVFDLLPRALPHPAAGNRRRPLLQHRSEEHTSELQSHSDLHSFPTRRSSDL